MTNIFHNLKLWFCGLLLLGILVPAIVWSIEQSRSEPVSVEVAGNVYRLSAGDASLSNWILPPLENLYADHDEVRKEALIELGRELFFDENLSGDRTMSCGTCHQPKAGWSDRLPTALPKPQHSHPRATPSLINLAYNTIFQWDGRAATMEQQVLGPLLNVDEMNITLTELRARLNSGEKYRTGFAEVFGEGPIDEYMLSLAIAAFERTLVSIDTRFDRWVAGDSMAMTAAEIRGFGVFLDPDKGSCAVCHSAPNFTDNGFHNIGLASFADGESDPGRHKIKPVKLMQGAFKTPSLRIAALTAPYFHDGSAETLEDVISHYEAGGEVKSNLSPEMKDISLSAEEKSDLLAFLFALAETPEHLPAQSAELTD